MQRTRGIVLRAMKYGETSMILHILTEESGILQFIVSGVRTKKSNLTAIYHPLQHLEVLHYPSKGENLARIKEAKLLIHYEHLLKDVPATALANFIIECVAGIVKTDDNNKNIYLILSDALRQIDTKPRNCANFHLYFLLQMAEFAGYDIKASATSNVDYFDLASGTFTSEYTEYGVPVAHRNVAWMNQLSGQPWEQSKTLSIPREEKHQILELLIQYFQYHIPTFKRPKSYDVFKVVFG